MSDQIFSSSRKQSVTDEVACPARAVDGAILEDSRVLSTLLANLSGMSYRCRNDEHWTMQFVSAGCFELTGYTAEDLLHNRTISYEQIIFPEDRDQVRRVATATMAKGSRFELAYRIVTASGEIRWVMERGLAIRSQDSGVDFIEGIITDINAGKCAELKLAEKERMLSAILDHSFEFIGLLDLEGRIIRANQTSLKSSGVYWEEVEGLLFWETPWWSHSPQEQAKLRDAIARAKLGEFVRFETTHPRKDGRMLHIDFSLKPVRDGEGQVVMMIPEGRDITEQKKAAMALRHSEEKFHRAFQSSPTDIVISRQSDGLILDANQSFLRARGLRIEEVRGRTVFELGLWTDRASRQHLLDELRRDGQVRNYPIIINLSGGRVGRGMLSVDPIEIQGEPCMLSTSIDITAKLESELALRESEEKFSKAFLASPYSLTISDLHTGLYIDVNSGFEMLSGYRREEAIGRTSTELGMWVSPDDRKELVRRMQEAGTVRGLEVDFRNKDGKVLTTLCNCEIIELGGRRCLLTVIEDITERRRAEKEKTLLEAQLRQNQKLESLGTLAGGIAHDFNNILTAIMVNRELAMMDIGRPVELKRRLEEIKKASHRAKDLVAQILTFSRQQPFSRERQSLQPVVKEALALVRSSLPSTIDVSMDLSPDAPQARVDATQVHQIVMNLCTNAGHAMGQKQGRLTVRLSRERLHADTCRHYPGLQPGGYARLTVADTGHGMDAEVLARIFEPFFTTKGPGEGTGLGLAVVHGIMKDFEGGIYVKSRPGEGSTFDLFFPEATETPAGTVVARTDVLMGNGETVLLVDDEPAVCEALAAMLRKIGYQVQRFTSPLMAWERFRGNPHGFDIVISDLTMPQLTGIALIAQVQRLRPGMPALLLSGYNQSVGGKSDEFPAVYEELAKPPDIRLLSLAVRRAIFNQSPRFHGPSIS